MICLNDSRGHLPHPKPPHQKIDVYVQYPCFHPPPHTVWLSSSPAPASFNPEIVLLCGWHNKLWSISFSCACVCEAMRPIRLEAVHIISAKHSILAGRQEDRTINITWYSCRCDNWRIHGLMDVQTTTVIEHFREQKVFWVCVFFFLVFRAESKTQVPYLQTSMLNVFTFLWAFLNVWAHLCLFKSVAFKVRDIGLVLQECAVCNAVYPQTS